MRGSSKALDLLKRVSEADESWCVPCGSPATECKRAIVVTTTHAESNPTGIEADEGKEHDIEPACTQYCVAFGLVYPKMIASLPSCQLDKSHATTEWMSIDAGYEHFATPLTCEIDEGCGVELGG
jgi:hypothetical protein